MTSGAKGRCHELANRVKHDSELPVVALLKLVKLVGQVLVRGEEAPQTDEGAHNLDVDIYDTLAAQDARQHRDTLLGERVGRVSAASPGA